MSLTVYKVVFMAELLVAEFLFTLRLKRRSKFWLRFAAMFVVGLLLAWLFPIVSYNAFYSSVMFLALFAATVGGLMLCYNESFVNIAYCAVAAYTMRHMSFQFYSLYVTLVTDSGATANAIYGSSATTITQNTAVAVLAYFLCYFIVYTLCYTFFARRIAQDGEFVLRKPTLLIWVVLILFVDIVLNAVVVYNSNEQNFLNAKVLYVNVITTYVYNILCCFFMLFIQFIMIDVQKLKRDLEVTNHIWLTERKQYQISKENIDLINRKCHDLKYQIGQIVAEGGANGNTVSKTDALTVDDKEIVITYQKKTAVVKITVTEKEIERELDITSTETKTYRVEAENAWLASEAAGKDKTQYLEYHSETQGNPNTSGGVSLGNLNYSDNPNNIIMVRIWSEVEATVSVNICLGAPEKPLDFDANTTTEWNDKTVTTGFIVAHSVSPQHYWYDWNEYTIEGLKLNKGLNKLAFHMDNFMPNVDYFDIVVNPEARELTDIKIQNFPKISYTEGDVFDPSNMVVIATYSNGHSYGVTGFTYDKTAALTPADTEVTISFGGLTAILRIKVKSLSNPYPGQTDVNIDETIKVEAEDCDVVNRDGEEVNIASLTEVHNNTTGNPDTSNGMSIGKMNNSQNTVKLMFTALADGTVTIRLRVAHYVRYVFDENTSTTINGEAIATGIVVNRDENTPYPWFDWHTYEIANVPVREGVNVFAVKLLEEKESVNYDYFEVVFTAKKEPTPEPIEMPDDVRIEAETCDIYGPSGDKLNTADYTEQHSAKEGNLTTSGGISVGKMGNSGNTLLLRYNSTVTATVRLLVRMSVTDAYVFDDNVVTKVNGVVVKTGLNLFRTADSKYVWFDWHVYTLGEFELKEGINELTITLNEGAEAINLDYFEFVAA